MLENTIAIFLSDSTTVDHNVISITIGAVDAHRRHTEAEIEIAVAEAPATTIATATGVIMDHGTVRQVKHHSHLRLRQRQIFKMNMLQDRHTIKNTRSRSKAFTTIMFL